MVREGASPHEIAMHLFNRVRMQLGWALRLERIGDDAKASGPRVPHRAAMASAAEGPFRESLFPRDAERPAADQVAVVGAAHALASPGEEHLERLCAAACSTATRQHELIIVAIALARCLAAGRPGRTRRSTCCADVRETLAEDHAEPVLTAVPGPRVRPACPARTAAS